MNVVGTGVPNHKVAQSAFAPAFAAERKGLAPARRMEIAILKDEYRNLVLPNLINQVRTRSLVQIGHSSADQGEVRILQLWQIEGERNLPLEPWLHGVPVGGNHIDRSSAGQCRHVQICQLAGGVLGLETIAV